MRSLRSLGGVDGDRIEDIVVVFGDYVYMWL